MDRLATSAQGSGCHWAAHPLPPPVRNRRRAAPDGAPDDELDILLAQWVEELRFGNTVDAD